MARRVDFTYDGQGRILSVSDASGLQSFNYVSATQTNITFDVGDGAPKVWSYIYDGAKRLTQIKSPPPNAGDAQLVTTFHYDSSGNVDEITDARGFKVTYKYDARGNRTRERDAEGNTVSRTFNDQNQVITETRYKSVDENGSDEILPSDPLTTRFVYDGSARLRFTISAEGRVTENRYGTGTADSGLLVRTIQYAGARYDASETTESALTSWVAGQDKKQVQQTQFEYDFRGDLAKRTDFATVGTDGNGVLDAGANVTEFIYDPHGRLLKTIAVRGAGRNQRTELTVIGYDGMGRERSRSSSNGTQTSTYDGNNKTITVTTQITESTSRIETRAFDDRGRLLSVTQAAGAITRPTKYLYDAGGRLRLMLDAQGGRRFSFYDAMGRLQYQVDSAGAVTGFEYNANGQLTKQTRYAQPARDMGSWVNNADNPTLVTKHSLTVGAAGSDVEASATHDRVTQYVYDKAGRLETQTEVSTDASIVTTTRYDGASRVTQQHNGDRITRYFYDRDGRQVGVVDALGYLTENKFDAAGRLVETVRYSTRSPSASNASGPVWVGTTNSSVVQNIAGDRSLAYRVGAVDADGDALTFSLVGTKPSWLNVDTTGVGGVMLTGTPPVSFSSYDVTLRAADGRGRTTDTAVRITVTVDNDGPVWTVVPTQKAFVGALFRFTVPQAQDPEGQALTYVVTSKPSWLTFNANTRELSGTPPALGVGRQTVEVQASDGFATSTLTIDLDVAVNSPPTWGTLTSIRLNLGFPSTHNFLAAVDPEGEPLTYSVVSGLPPHVGFSSQHRLISYGFDGDPERGDYTVVLRAADPHGGSVDRSFVLKVRDIVDPAELAALAELAPLEDVLSSWRPTTSADDLHSYQYYDSQGRIVGSVDERGFLTETVYDAHLNKELTRRYQTAVAASGADTLASVKARAGAALTSAIEYDGMGRVFKRTDVHGTVTRSEYDSIGRLVREVRAFETSEARASRIRYNEFGEVTGTVGGEGDAAGLSTDDAIAQYGTRYEYDSAGRRIKAIDARGNATLFYYDREGRLTHTINPKGEVSETAYNVFGQIQSTHRYARRIAVAKLELDPPPQWLLGGLVSDALLSEVALLAVPDKDRVTTYEYDQQGHVKSTTDGEGFATINTYNTFGQLATQVRTILQAAGQAGPQTSTTQYNYDLRGALLATTADLGGINFNTQTRYDAFGRVIQSLDGAGKVTSTSYKDSGRAIEVTQRVGGADRMIRTQYDAFARVLKQIDASGKETLYVYNDAARSVSVTTPEGVTVTTTKTRHGEVLTVVDGRNKTTSYEYNKDGQLKKVTDALDQVVAENEYDKSGLLSQTTDARGIVTTFRYDSMNQLFVRRVDGAGLNLVTTYQMTAFGDRLSMTEGVGNIGDGNITRETLYKYDRNGRLTDVITDPDGQQLLTRYSYDGLGNTIKVERGTLDSPQQQVTLYEFDKLGRRVKEIAAPSSVFGAGSVRERNLTNEYRYDAAGRVSRKIDALGQSTWYAYNEAGELTHTVNAEGEVSQSFYDVNGRVVRTHLYAARLSAGTLAGLRDVLVANTVTPAVNGTDRLSYFVYDKDGRVRFTLQGMSDKWLIAENRYDQNGNVIEARRYDKALTDARIIAMTSDAQVTDLITVEEMVAELRDTLLYDETNTDTLAQVQRTRFAYDANNRLRFTVDALGSVSENVYDKAGNLIALVRYAVRPTLTGANPTESDINAAVGRNNTANQVSRFVYDAAGRQVYSARVLGFNGSGQALHVISKQVYDAVGRVVQSLAYAKAMTLADYERATLDAAVNLPANRSVEDRRTAFAYDGAGRQVYSIQVAEINDEGVATRHIVSKREYDALGQVVSNTSYATAITATLSDYQTATLDAAVAAIASSSHDRVTAFVYDKAGRQRFTVAPNGSLNESIYDALGQVTERRQFDLIVSATAARTEEALVALRGERAVGDTVTRGEKYTYDRAGRVRTTTDARNVVETDAYDAMGNRISHTNKNGDTWTYTYDRLGRLRTEVSPAIEVQLSDGTKSMRALTTFLEYDAFGNLKKRTEANGTIDSRATTFEYDSLGRLELTALPGFYDPDKGTVERTAAAGRFQRTIQVIYDALGNTVRTKTRLAPGSAAGNFQNEYKTYDALGRVVHDVDALKHATGFTYNAFGEQLTVTRYSLVVSGAPANGDFWLASEVAGKVAADNAARTITMKYDNLGRKTEVAQPPMERYFRNGGGISGSTPPPSPVTKYQYNVFGEIQRESIVISTSDFDFPEGVRRDTWHYFDTMGREIRTIDSLGYHTARSYDPFGNLKETVEYAVAGAGGSSALAPPATPVNDTKDRITAFTYDALNRTTAIERKNLRYTQWNPISTSYEQLSTGRNGAKTVSILTYDNEGHVRTQTDALGNVTTTEYNKLGQVAKVTEPTRVTAGAGVDPFLNQVQGSPVTALTLNAFGQVVKQERSPGGGRGETLTTSHSYDQAGNAISSTDANGNVKLSQYDFAGRVVKQTQSINVTLGNWRKAGGVVGSWQPVSHTLERRYAYDATGRQTHVLDVFMQGATLTQSGRRSVFNAFGEVVEEQRVAGAVSAALDSLTSITTAKYAYDKGGRLITREAADGKSEYFYDLTGQVTRQEQHDNDASDGVLPTRITDTSYDTLGRAALQRLPSYRALVSVNDGAATLITPLLVQEFDRWGNVTRRLQGIYRESTGVVVSEQQRITQYEYNHDNKVIVEKLPQAEAVRTNGVAYQARRVHELHYDLLGRVVEELDAADDVSTAANEALTPLRTRRKEYNAAGQLSAEVDGTQIRTEYVYDAHGNRVGIKNADKIVFVDTFDKNGNLTSHSVLRIGAFAYRSGVDSNPTARKISQYQYDQANRRIASVEMTDTFVSGTSLDDWTFTQFDERGYARATFNIRALPFSSGIVTIDPGRVVNTCTYDEYGHKTSEKDVLNNTRTWEYNTGTGVNFDFGRLTKATAGGRQTQYTYDDLGQLEKEVYSGTGISTVDGEITDRIYQYHDNGLLKQLTDHAFYGTRGMTGGADYLAATDITDYDYTVNGERAREAYSRTGSAENGIYAFNDQSGEFDLVSVGSPTAIAGITRTTRTTYDALGRMVKVETPANTGRTVLNSLKYQYDEFSNRRHIEAKYTQPGVAQQTSDKWYTYDAEGRVMIVDGVLSDGQIKAGHSGTRITYDGLGRRSTAETFVSLFGMTGRAPVAGQERPPWMHFNPDMAADETITGDEFHQESYEYDDQNQLARVRQRANFRNVRLQRGNNPPPATPNSADQEGTWVISSVRSNDLQGRVHNLTQYGNVHLNATGNQTASILSRTVELDYDSRGLMKHQKTTHWRFNNDNGEDEVESISHVDNDFDAAGVLLGYTFRALKADGSVDYTNTYEYDYTDEFGGYKEARITVRSTKADTGRGETQNQYDARGNLIRQTLTDNQGTRTRTFANSADGQITSKDEFFKKTSGEVVANETGSADYFYVGGQQVGAVGNGKLAATTQFSSGFTPISAAYPSTSPGSYTVNAQDSLASIAANVFGDASLWYLIADANSLSFGPGDLLPPSEVGRTYRIPNVVTGTHNNANTFKPYNAANIIGDTTPSPGLPMPPPGACDSTGRQLLAVMITAASMVVRIVAQALLTPYVGPNVAAAIGGGLGSITEQGLSYATGLRDDFSWQEVGEATLTSFAQGFASGATAKISDRAVRYAAEQASSIAIAELAEGATGQGWNVDGNRVLSRLVTQMAVQSISTGIAEQHHWGELAAAGSEQAMSRLAYSGAFQSVAVNALDPYSGWLLNDRSRDWSQIAAHAVGAFGDVAVGRAFRKVEQSNRASALSLQARVAMANGFNLPEYGNITAGEAARTRAGIGVGASHALHYSFAPSSERTQVESSLAAESDASLSVVPAGYGPSLFAAQIRRAFPGVMFAGLEGDYQSETVDFPLNGDRTDLADFFARVASGADPAQVADGAAVELTDADSIIRVGNKKPKGKVWGTDGLIDEPIKTASGAKAGHAKMGRATLKVGEEGVEVDVTGLDVEIMPEIVEGVNAGFGTKVAKLKARLGVDGVTAEATAFEASVGGKAGPVKGKVAVGLGVGFSVESRAVKVKVVAGVGGEVELDMSGPSMIDDVANEIALRQMGMPNVDLTVSEPEPYRRLTHTVSVEAPPPPVVVPKRSAPPARHTEWRGGGTIPEADFADPFMYPALAFDPLR